MIFHFDGESRGRGIFVASISQIMMPESCLQLQSIDGSANTRRKNRKHLLDSHHNNFGTIPTGLKHGLITLSQTERHLAYPSASNYSPWLYRCTSDPTLAWLMQQPNAKTNKLIFFGCPTWTICSQKISSIFGSKKKAFAFKVFPRWNEQYPSYTRKYKKQSITSNFGKGSRC